MIRTDLEYQEAVRRFREDLQLIEKQKEAFAEAGLTAEEVDTAMQPMYSFHYQLSDEITWYENVLRGNFEPTKRLTDVGRLLIAARIARKMTQRTLAQKLGVSEAQVSRDERNEYHGITLDRAQRIFDALEYDTITKLETTSERYSEEEGLAVCHA